VVKIFHVLLESIDGSVIRFKPGNQLRIGELQRRGSSHNGVELSGVDDQPQRPIRLENTEKTIDYFREGGESYHVHAVHTTYQLDVVIMGANKKKRARRGPLVNRE
jgi:hypothetical protein